MYKFYSCLALILCLVACQSEQQKQSQMRAEIKKLERQLTTKMDTSTFQLDSKIAKELVEKSEAYAATFPKDSSSADVLFRAADMARGARNFGKAIQLWGNVHDNFPNYARTPDALFLQAFTFENDLGDKETAKRYYEKFLQMYPQNPIAEQVKQLLSMLDKSPEEMIKAFQAMNEKLNTK